MEPLKLALRAVVLRVARLLGSPVVDVRTGQVLGRALLVPFRGGFTSSGWTRRSCRCSCRKNV